MPFCLCGLGGSLARWKLGRTAATSCCFFFLFFRGHGGRAGGDRARRGCRRGRCTALHVPFRLFPLRCPRPDTYTRLPPTEVPEGAPVVGKRVTSPALLFLHALLIVREASPVATPALHFLERFWLAHQPVVSHTYACTRTYQCMCAHLRHIQPPGHKQEKHKNTNNLSHNHTHTTTHTSAPQY